MFSSDIVDELPSEVQDDIMELYNNFVEGVRAPDVRIEEVDVVSNFLINILPLKEKSIINCNDCQNFQVSHVTYMEEDQEQKEEEQKNQEKEDELVLNV